ncbi:MAG TPA: hypothetical protein VJV79_37335 [Polyangiaceae bacterium]|nr:hypothetical protein [Polyangiaceae bacterium]
MDTTNTQAPASTNPSQRGSSKLGLGIFLVFLAALLALAATVLIWFGIFPGLIAIGVAIPLAIVGSRLMRKGEPATTLPE